MQLSDGVEWSLHCAWLLALPTVGRSLSANRMATFYGLPEAYLAKLLKALVSANVLRSSTGPRGGYRLARDADQITVLDVVQAIEGANELFHCAEIRQRGPVPLSPSACRAPCGIAQVMHRAEQAWRRELAQTTVADLVHHASTGSISRASRWLQNLAA